ncbi:MAG: pentapeptide repeat-containing protein [Gemmatimonadota bacterium]
MPDERAPLHAHTQLPGSRLVDVDLRDSIFENVSLQRASFIDVKLASAVFRNVDLSHASISDARLDGMTINGVLVTELFRVYQKGRGQ